MVVDVGLGRRRDRFQRIGAEHLEIDAPLVAAEIPLGVILRRVLVIVDAPANDVFTVVGNVTLTAIDDQRGQLVVKWYLKDPAGKNVGDLEQSNPVPLAATKGSWAGFGDIVATAASEGVLELLEKALTSARP